MQPREEVVFDGTQDLTVPRDRPLIAPLIRLAVFHLEADARKVLALEPVEEGCIRHLTHTAEQIGAAGRVLSWVPNDPNLPRAEINLAVEAGDALVTIAAALQGLASPPKGLTAENTILAAYSLARHFEHRAEAVQGLSRRIVES